MLAEERRQLILAEIKQKKSVLVTNLSNKYGVSVVTIRKDLEYLENKGGVTKTFGGAILKEEDHQYNLPEVLRVPQMDNADFLIISEALNFVKDGDTIMLEQGELVSGLAKAISEKRSNLTIITNSINTAVEAAKSNNDIIITGGILREKTMSMIGHLAERVVEEIDASCIFIEAESISENLCVKTSKIVESNTLIKFINKAKKTIVLARNESFQHTAPILLANIDEKMVVITDDRVSEKTIAEFSKNNLELVIAQGDDQREIN